MHYLQQCLINMDTFIMNTQLYSKYFWDKPGNYIHVCLLIMENTLWTLFWGNGGANINVTSL